MTELGRSFIVAADSASIDSFARLRASNPVTLFDSKQLWDNAPLFWDDQEVSGSGTGSAHSTATASTVISVGATTAGKRVRQTFQRFNYQPGKSQLIFLTGTLSESGGGAGITRCMGYYDDNDGIFFRDNEGTLEAVIRSSASGSAVDTAVSQANWNLDPLDGTGPSEVTLDPTKSQISITDMEWLGVGRARVGFVIDGLPIYVHEFLHANVLAGVYMSSPNLPLRYEVENDGAGAASSLECICSTVISEGGQQENGILRYDSTAGTHIDANTENTIYVVMGIRLKSTHLNAVVNFVSSWIQLQTGSETGEWTARLNPTVTGGTPTWTGQTNSSVETTKGDGSLVVTAGTGYSVAGGPAQSTSGGGGSGGTSSSIPTSRGIGAAIDGTVDEIYLCWMPTGGSTSHDVEGGVTWRELS